MAKKKRSTSLRDRVSSQAQQEAELKYAPQRRALTDSQRSIVDQFNTAAKTEQASARGIAASIDQVKPQVAGYVSNAQGVSNQAQGDLASYLAGSPLQGAAARDAAGTTRRLSEMLANTNTELDQRKIDAAAGAKYTISSLRSNAAKALEDVGGKLSDLASDEGTYAANQDYKYRQAAAGRAVTKRGQDLSHADRVAAREQRQQQFDARQRDAGKPKPASAATLNRAKSDVAYALQVAKEKKDTASRSQVGKWLITGRPSQSVSLPDGSKQQVPGINKTNGQGGLYASVALDVAFDGHVSRANARKLHDLGITVKDLGLPSYSEWAAKGGLPRALRGLGGSIRNARARAG